MLPQTVNLIYQTAFILFIISILMLFILFIIRSSQKRKSFASGDDLHNHVSNSQENNHNVGIVEVPESADTYTKNKHTTLPLRDIINKVINPNSKSNEQETLQRYWNSQLSQLKDHLKISKVLLLQVHKDSKIEIGHYYGFNLDCLKDIEAKLTHKDNLLKDLVLKGKHLYFQGKLTQSKIFSLFFSENESKNYDRLYISPLFVEKKIVATLFLISEESHNPISTEELKNILNQSAIS